MTRVTATVAAGSGPDAYALRDWLNDADELRGKAAIHPPPPAIGQTGSITDVVTVAVGSGGVAALLVKKVYDWSVLRRNATTDRLTCLPSLRSSATSRRCAQH